MPLEDANNVNELNENWPLPKDSRKEGDDHLRMIKKVLKNDLSQVNKVVDTVAAMKADTTLAAGDYIQTVDYYSTQRGGGASYLIKTTAQAAADGDVYSATTTGNILLSNGNVAVLQAQSGGIDCRKLGVPVLAGVNSSPLLNDLITVYPHIVIPYGVDVWVNETLAPVDGTTIEINGQLRKLDNSNSNIISSTADNITVCGNGTIDGRKDSQTGGNGVILSGDNCRVSVTIKEAFSNGLLFFGGADFELSNSEIFSCGNYGALIQNGANNPVVHSNKIYSNGRGGLNIAHAGSAVNNITVINNRSLNNGVTGTGYESGIRVQGASSGIISENTCNGNLSGAGIVLSEPAGFFGATGITVIGNNCRGNNDGITIDDGSNGNTISGNICKFNTKDGIDCNDTSGNNIVNNTCDNNGQKGILSWGMRNGSISNNICRNNNTSLDNGFDSGINIQQNQNTLTESSNILIQGNICKDSQSTQTQFAGLVLRGDSQNIRVLDNDFDGNKSKGVRLQDNVTDCDIRRNTGDVDDQSTGDNAVEYRKADGGSKNISSDEITITHKYHVINSEGGAPTDDLATINGGTEFGQFLTIRASSGATITVKDAIGNLRLDTDFIMDNQTDSLTLMYIGTNWIEISRSNNA